MKQKIQALTLLSSTLEELIFQQCYEMKQIYIVFSFHFYIYRPDSQESDGGANT